jgi:hypothetical protein
MLYLYHKVPDNLVGHTLYPLNRLKGIHPEAYAAEVKKYEWRKHIMDRTIPILNCLWNDALHFSPVHPKEIKDALGKLGFDGFKFSFFELDAGTIDPRKAVIYKYTKQTRELQEDDFEPYDPDRLNLYDRLPAATSDYFRRRISKGFKPLFFYGIPHILAMDNIDVSRTPIIKI